MDFQFKNWKKKKIEWVVKSNKVNIQFAVIFLYLSVISPTFIYRWNHIKIYKCKIIINERRREKKLCLSTMVVYVCRLVPSFTLITIAWVAQSQRKSFTFFFGISVSFAEIKFFLLFFYHVYDK